MRIEIATTIVVVWPWLSWSSAIRSLCHGRSNPQDFSELCLQRRFKQSAAQTFTISPSVSASKLMSLVRSLLIAACLSICVLGCSLAQNKRVADRAIRRFHDQFNEQRAGEMYQQADTSLKNLMTEKQFTEMLRQANTQLGKVQSIEQEEWRSKWNEQNGSRVTVTVKTKFAKGKASEFFVWAIEGEEARLCNYRISIEIGGP